MTEGTFVSREEYQRLLANEQPNVVLENPLVRKVLAYVLGIAAIVLPILGLVDGAYNEIDWTRELNLASQINLFLLGLYAVGVTAQNINTSR
jgi:hypothetical protein